MDIDKQQYPRFLIKNGEKIKCQQCGGDKWVKPTDYSISAYCAKCDSILEFKVEK